MEDWNMVAADCAVISCCCQCLILQLLIFVLLKLPRKLIQKTKEYAKKKLLWGRKKGKTILETVEGVRIIFQDSFLEFQESCVRIQVEDFQGGHNCGSCMEEVERVLEEFSEKGEFAFGSFWGRAAGPGTSQTCVAVQEFDSSVVQFELVETIATFFRRSS